MFHSKCGLCFERLLTADQWGSVRVAMIDTQSEMQDGGGKTLAVLAPNEWASVVASMSALGETGTTFRMFLEMQK
jgi:hypothetical protein